MKMVVNKSPDGTKSPNLADAIVMAYWPIPKPVTATFGTYG
jgi:phage terminase large subunit